MDRTAARRKWGEAYEAWYWAKRHKYEQAEIVAHILEYRKYRTKAELDDMVRFYGDAPPAWIAFGESDGKWTRTEIYDPRPEVKA